MKIKTKVKAGGLAFNHNQSGIAVKSKVKAGGLAFNHNRTCKYLKPSSGPRDILRERLPDAAVASVFPLEDQFSCSVRAALAWWIILHARHASSVRKGLFPFGPAR